MSFHNKIVVITGGNGGIGAVIAQMLAARGAIPILTARSEERLKEVTSRLQGEHASYILDVTSTEQVYEVMGQIIDRYGKIDILINNAGYGVFSRFVETDLRQMAEMMDVNYMGTVRCTQAVLPHMLAAGQGSIVNIASMAGKIGSAKSTGYSATKHAVLGFTNSLRQELVGTGVHLAAVNPGPVDTPFFDRADPTGHYVDNIRWFMLKPEKVAQVVLQVIERRTGEKNIPLTASVGVKLYQLFPQLFEKIAFKMMNKK